MYEILTAELLEEIEKADRLTQGLWLFLEQSEEFRGYWQVSSLWPEFFLDLEEVIGSYRLVTPLGLEAFLEYATNYGYRVAFLDDPVGIIQDYERLQEDPLVSIRSDMPNTRQGFLPWQVVGFNKLVKDDDLKAGYAVWCTGSGKTVLIAASILYHPYDLALVVVKSHNKIDIQRKLKRLGDIDSIVVEGTPEKRQGIYDGIADRLKAGQPTVVILNYEKFRDDKQAFRSMVRKQKVLCFWDEMPTKLSNPDTQMYKAVKKVFYDSFSSKPRFQTIRQWCLSATPIENDPGGVWACCNILWPKLLGAKTQFEATYVAYKMFGKPRRWHKLDHLEAQIGFMVHSVSQDDPEVRDMFPEVMPPDPVQLVDWHPKHRSIYDKLAGKAIDLLDEFEDANILAMIQIMQMVCDAPSMIHMSRENRELFNEFMARFAQDEEIPQYSLPKGSEIAMTLLSVVDPKLLTDTGHTKLETWREIICDKHPDDKIVTHSTWANYIFPVWEHWLQKWDISYVIYAGTDKQKQIALDRFRDDPSIRVFLSGDSGADSIDISEARVGVNYNIPWKWTTLMQRQGRRHRVNSEFDVIYTYDLVMPDSVDERKLEICERKRQYHEALFQGKATEEAISATLTREELMYLITGRI